MRNYDFDEVVEIMAKKKNKELEPEFVRSLTNQSAYNYSVYYLKTKEKILWGALAFVIGAVAAYIFYGGIGKNSYGEPTVVTHICNTVIMLAAGAFAAKMFLPIRKEQILKKRKKNLRVQFVALLDSLSVSFSTGMNAPGAFETALNDLRVQYKEDSYIVQEVQMIVDGNNMNIPIEEMLGDFGKRSGIRDIESFGQIFETVYRQGGDMKDIVRATHEIISSKTQIEMEIETMVASNKNEQKIMLVMPFMIIGMIKLMGGDFAANFTTPSGLIFTTIGVFLFIISYYIGKVVLNIEV